MPRRSTPHDDPADDQRWMLAALDQAARAIDLGQTPFGAVIVREGALIAAAHNQVWARTDPTAHAEVVAIRLAAEALRTIDLSGCTMLTTCEPCPMCAAAIHWARLDAVAFGASIDDARRAGFRELALPIADLYRLGGATTRVRPGVLRDRCAAVFDAWLARAGRRAY